MNHSSFGSPEGHLVIYFHGAPDAPSEAQVFDASAKAHGRVHLLRAIKARVRIGNDWIF